MPSIFKLVIWLCVAATSFAAAPSSQPDSNPADLCAGDAALQQLVHKVLSLRLTNGHTVSELFEMIPQAECQLRQAVYANHQRSAVRQRADDTIEIDAWLPRPLVTQIIQKIASHYMPDAELPVIDKSAGPSVSATARVSRDTQPIAAPPGWRHCSAHQLEITRSAAEIDLRQNLLMRLTDWRLSASQTLGQLWLQRPDFHRAVRQQIKALPLGQPIFEPTGLCRLPAEFGRDAIVRLLIRSANQCHPAIEADLSQAIDPDFQNPLVLDGLAVTPPITSASSHDLPRTYRPPWADRFLTTRQTGQPPSDVTDVQARRAKALTAARIEAKRQLWMQIEHLKLPTGDTIGERLADSRKASSAVAAIDVAILPIGEPVFDKTDGASISLGIQLKTVWDIVCRLSTRNELEHQ